MRGTEKGKSFIIIMVAIAFLAVATRFGVSQLLSFMISQNESSAVTHLKLLGTALENYSQDNHSVYPTEVNELLRTDPAYLKEDFVLYGPMKGYIIYCSRLEKTGYSCSATPLKCRWTGSTVFTVTTGVTLSTQKCAAPK